MATPPAVTNCATACSSPALDVDQNTYFRKQGDRRKRSGQLLVEIVLDMTSEMLAIEMLKVLYDRDTLADAWSKAIRFYAAITGIRL